MTITSINSEDDMATTSINNEEDDIVYDVPNLDFFDINPRYPTIDPKTICHDRSKWGNWVLDRNLTTQNVVKLQKECMERKESYLMGPVEIDSEEYTGVSDEEFSTQTLTDPSSRDCELQLALEFPKINHYCRKDNTSMSALNLNEMTDTFCETGKYTMQCINPNNFQPRQINASCNEENRKMFFCTDGTVSCTPCAFDRLELERNLHQGFLTDFCENNKHTADCRSKGLNSETGKAYNRGFLHTGF